MLRGSQLVDNHAATTGGCIYAAAAALEAYNTTFRKNSAGESRLFMLVLNLETIGAPASDISRSL